MAKKRTSPTQRTLAYLRKQGWTVGVVEKWIPQTMRRVDFLGGIDLIAVREGETLGVQATSTANASARVKKLRELPTMQTWKSAGNKLWVIGWAKRGRAGKRKLWTPTITEL